MFGIKAESFFYRPTFIQSLIPSSFVQSGPKSDIPLVFEFPHLLGAFYLQFLFTHVSFALNDVIIRW